MTPLCPRDAAAPGWRLSRPCREDCSAEGREEGSALVIFAALSHPPLQTHTLFFFFFLICIWVTSCAGLCVNSLLSQLLVAQGDLC